MLARKTTHCLDGQDNIKTWTGLPVESVRMTEDRDKRRKYARGVANPQIEDGKKQNRLNMFAHPGGRISSDVALF